MKFKKIILPSGLRVIMAPSKESPTATALVLVAAGSKYEDKRISGLSHFLEHMLFEGTNKFPNSMALSSFIENSDAFYACINDFNAFQKILDVKASGNLTVDKESLDFGETSGQVVMKFTYPVKLSKGNATTLVDNYVMKIPINLARVRETSVRITNSIASGKNYIEVIDEENQIQWDQLRADANAEKIMMSSQAFSEVPSTLSNVNYNTKNLL